MKKNIKPVNKTSDNIETNNILTSAENESIVDTEQKAFDKSSAPLELSICTLLSTVFLVLLIAGVTVRFVFPGINSYQAGIKNVKVGKSIVYNYFNLLENSNYEQAMKLLDVDSSAFNSESLAETINQQFGTNSIVGCDISEVIDKSDYSIVNTAITYVNDGIKKTRNQSMLVKNTPEGWRISLNGIIKRFNLDPVSASFDNKFSLRLEEIEYCVEGINLKFKVNNNTYEKIGMNGDLMLSTETGKYKANINSTLMPKVNYDHNVLFEKAEGEPETLIINMNGRDNDNKELPVKIIK